MIPRTLQPRLESLVGQYPAVFLTCPRQAGVLVYGGPESFPRGRHLVRSWWHLAGGPRG